MKKQKKSKFKEFIKHIKKPLMVVSILFNILFGLALIIGLSSNNKKTEDVNAIAPVTELSNKTFDFKKPSELVFTNDMFSSSNINFTNTSSSFSCPNLDLDYSFTWLSLYGQNGAIGEHIGFNVGSGNLYYFTNGVNSQTSRGAGCYYYKNSNTSYTLKGDEPFSITFGDLSSLSVSDYNRVLLFVNSNIDYDSDDTESNNSSEIISLTDGFNPTNYFTQNGNYIFNGFAGKHTNASTGYLDFTGLTFNSNGEQFNRIRFLVGNIPAIAPNITQDGTTYINCGSDYSDYLCCFGVLYQNVNSENVVTKSLQVVSYRRTIVVDNNVSINCYDVRQPYMVWLNNNYRQLEVVEDLGTIMSDSYLTIEGMTTRKLLGVTSTINSDVVGMTDVFGLLKGAFAGITGILAISILPGITLGLLLFIPLIVTIIVTVVKLIKK